MQPRNTAVTEVFCSFDRISKTNTFELILFDNLDVSKISLWIKCDYNADVSTKILTKKLASRQAHGGGGEERKVISPIKQLLVIQALSAHGYKKQIVYSSIQNDIHLASVH